MPLIKYRHIRKVPRRGRTILWFIKDVMRGFSRSGGFSCCGNLTYTLLLAFIPFSVAMVSISELMPFSSKLISDIEYYIYNQFIPQTGSDLYALIKMSFENARHLSLFGIISLAASAYGVLLAIEQGLNQILRVKRSRKLYKSLLIISGFYIIGAFIAYFVAAVCQWLSIIWSSLLAQEIIDFIGLHLFSLLNLSCLYGLLPHRKIMFKEAAAAGLFATIAFIGIQAYFNWCMESLREQYVLLYGTLVTLPIFLLWIYLSVLVLLVGAQIMCSLKISRRRV